MLHFVAVSNNEIMACSFAGTTSTVNAVLRQIKERNPIDIVGSRTYRFEMAPGEYQSMAVGTTEGVQHGMFLHESCFPSNSDIQIVLSKNGDMLDVADFLIEKFALLPIWRERYPKIFDWHIRKVTVIKNTLVPDWKNLQAYQIELTEEDMKRILTTHLRNHNLVIPPDNGSAGEFNPGWDLRQYLKRNAPGIAEEIRKLQPYYDNTNPNRRVNRHFGTMGRILLPSQTAIAQSVNNRLREANYVFINGEMGSGKSIIFNALANVKYRTDNECKYTPILLTAPSTIIPKWKKKEIEPDLIEAKITEIKSTEDALKFIQRVRDKQTTEGLEFVLLSIDQAKQGPVSWAGAALWKRIRGSKTQYAWHCPDCQGILADPELKDEERVPLAATWESMAKEDPAVREVGRTSGGIPLKKLNRSETAWKSGSNLIKCHHCGSKLWRPATRSCGDQGAKKPRWYIYKLFQKKLRKFFHIYCADEVHRQRSESQRSYAYGGLVRSAQKVVGLTGTLTNGMSSAVRDLLWHVAPYELIKKGYDYRTGPIRFARNYGAVTTRSRERFVSGENRRYVRVNESPGISPRLIVDYLMDCTAFLELQDLGFPLPEKKEIPVFINMDPRHHNEYEDFHKKLTSFSLRGARGGMVPATINYADSPHREASVQIKWRYRSWQHSHQEERIITAPALPGFSAKERKLAEIVQENLREDRGCVIFTFYTGAYKTNQRIKYVLEEHGVSADILPNLSPDKRAAWLEKKEKEGQKVIISNLALIGEGLDLLPWPSLIFYQISYSVDQVRQAGGRAWRIGQTKECRNYYLIVNGSQQVAQFETVMARRGHSLLVEGKIDKSALAQYARDAYSTLAADIANCLIDNKAADQMSSRWNRLAEADMQGVETYSEREYKEAVRQAMKALTAETKRLCGIGPDEKVGQLWLPEGLRLSVVEKPGKRGSKKIVAAGQLTLVDW
ncbi:MAG: hypothetical protein AVO34_06915 [Firmicutes bacterium ML8_F2]|nr:MAG: hypothetical protein AVO34_06915 [Firmicutes bacterium ML8_F2]